MFESQEEQALAEYASVLDSPGAEPLDQRAALSWLETAVPSSHSLLLLDCVDPQLLDANDRVTVLTVWERHRSWLEAQVQRVLVVVGGPAPQPGDARDDWAREDVACALRLSTETAADRLDVARELAGRLSATGKALADGRISYGHARALSEAVSPFEDVTVVNAIESQALDDGPAFETLTAFRRRLARVVIAADPRTADEQHDRAVCNRRVAMWSQPFGMATLEATLTADEAMTAMAAMNALADRAATEGDQRPVDVRRADAFSSVFAVALADPTLPEQQHARPRVGVTIDWATLVRLADNPGHLDGYGPIPPEMARRIAVGGDWHRFVTDPVTGALLDYGRTTYRPPADLAAYITARDRTCRFPTCSRSAQRCDIDHAQPFEEGGHTSSRNCGAACRRNHRQKTHGNWRLRSHPDGSATWTTPTGHVIHRPAVDHRPEHTAYLRALRAAEPEPPDPWSPEAVNATMTEDPAASENADAAATRAPTDAGTAPLENEADPDTSSGNDPPPF